MQRIIPLVAYTTWVLCWSLPVRSFELVQFNHMYCAPADRWEISIEDTIFGIMMVGVQPNREVYARLLTPLEIREKPLDEPEDDKWHVCARFAGADSPPVVLEVRRPRESM